MPFGIVGRTGPGMRQVVGFGDRSAGMGTFGGEFGALHCIQWGLYGVRVRQYRDAALFSNYFGQTCCSLRSCLLPFMNLFVILQSLFFADVESTKLLLVILSAREHSVIG